MIAFPITINSTVPVANGNYVYTLQGPVVSQDGKSLVTFNGNFNLNVTDGPKILGTSINGRVITIQFNEGAEHQHDQREHVPDLIAPAG